MSVQQDLLADALERWLRDWSFGIFGVPILASTSAQAAQMDLSRARQLIGEGSCQRACDLPQRPGSTARGDAEFNLVLGETTLRIGRADLARGDHARVKKGFETVLRFDELPPCLLSQVEIYAAAALACAEVRRLLGSGCAIAGHGNDRSGARSGGPENDAFFSARVGGNLNDEFADGGALNGSLDARFRDDDTPPAAGDRDWSGTAALRLQTYGILRTVARHEVARPMLISLMGAQAATPGARELRRHARLVGGNAHQETGLPPTVNPLIRAKSEALRVPAAAAVKPGGMLQLKESMQ